MENQSSGKKIIKPQTLKGFRDFLPADANARNLIIQKIRKTFELYGFEPLETPALEYADTLLGKYGSEADKLLYLFNDRGGRKVGLRYDQTVPLSRVIAQYPQIPRLFKRYQIQPVWRADNTQKGRYREFVQCDIDIVGTEAELADAEIISCTLNTFNELGITQRIVWLNDRTIFDNLGFTKQEIIILDKLEKIGDQAVIEELKKMGRKNAAEIFTLLKNTQPTPRIKKIFTALEKEGFSEKKDFLFVPYMARGLDYYTSTIFEVKVESYTSSSLAGGGRYDKLIGQFTGNDIPAVGIAFGFDRLVDVILENNLISIGKTPSKVLVTVFNPEYEINSLDIATQLRKSSINTEIYLDPLAKLDRQLKYADQKDIPFVVVLGPDEVQKNVVQLKNMREKTQREITVEELVKILKT
ncbi:histidine--tRNA ligase [Candidatus Microgenomates bacterium]|nr:histidine--tRNA ligase [Candidatus Microgenomates bacterium]